MGDIEDNTEQVEEDGKDGSRNSEGVYRFRQGYVRAVEEVVREEWGEGEECGEDEDGGAFRTEFRFRPDGENKGADKSSEVYDKEHREPENLIGNIKLEEKVNDGGRGSEREDRDSTIIETAKSQICLFGMAKVQVECGRADKASYGREKMCTENTNVYVVNF